MQDRESPCAVITGGTRGIGAALAQSLAGRGARLVLNGREKDAEVEALLAELEPKTDVRFVAGSVADPSFCIRLIEEAGDAFGRIDMLIHSAGGAVNGGVLDLSEDEWMQAFAVHVHPVFHLFRAAHPFLAKRGGSVLLISSAAGLRGCPKTIAYQTVKGALPQMARALARDHGAEGIRVNVIAPGIIETRFHAAMTDAARQNNLENRIPLKRFGTPEQVATASIELLTNEFITGETLVIDGGMTMRMV